MCRTAFTPRRFARCACRLGFATLGVAGMLGVAVGGEPAVADPTESAQLEDLLALLEQQTELATSSRMNADYIPGMATVLRGEELLARGVRTVWEALALVPGLTQGMEFTGERQILSRGVGHGYASGNIKFLLDDVSLNSAFTAQADPLLNMPIEQVERIEVIRGPGSSIHGEYAYAGVVNVVSRHQGRTLYAGGGSYSSFQGGGIWQLDAPERDLKLSLNLAGAASDGADSQVDRDALFHSAQADLSNAPGSANEASRYQGALADLTWGEGFASLKLLEDRFGDHFGINHYLPPASHQLVTTNRYAVLEVGRNFTLSDSLHGRFRLEALRHEHQRDHLYVAPAELWGNRESIYMDRDYREHRWLADLSMNWHPGAHEILFGLEASATGIDNAGWHWSGYEWELPKSWIDEAMSRRILAFVVQDQYRLSDQVTLTATIRHDDYSDVGEFFSPRLAAVWRLDQIHILKAQFARAFRPPTFYEQYYASDGAIDPSEIQTCEVGYIEKRPSWEWRLTLFKSRLDDPILFDSPGVSGYDNGDNVRSRGVELEYEQRLGGSIKLDGSLSFVDAKTVGGDPVAGGARWLANLGVLWQPDERWIVALQGRYVGERARSQEDPRSPLSPTTVADLTLTYRAPLKGLTLRGGVKNLGDADVRFPDQVTVDSFGEFYLPYPDDYPQPGRQWWLTASYDF